MKKEQFFHFRRDTEDPTLLVPPSPQADSRGGICIFAQPIEKEYYSLGHRKVSRK
jgi:hypothetical protein